MKRNILLVLFLWIGSFGVALAQPQRPNNDRHADPHELRNLIADPSTSLIRQEMDVELDSLLGAAK